MSKPQHSATQSEFSLRVSQNTVMLITDRFGYNGGKQLTDRAMRAAEAERWTWHLPCSPRHYTSVCSAHAGTETRRPAARNALKTHGIPAGEPDSCWSESRTAQIPAVDRLVPTRPDDTQVLHQQVDIFKNYLNQAKTALHALIRSGLRDHR